MIKGLVNLYNDYILFLKGFRNTTKTITFITFYFLERFLAANQQQSQ